MSEGENPSQNQSLVPQNSQADHPTGDQASNQFIREILDLERQRVASTNRRTDVALRAIEAGDASDKRQYEYHVEKMRQNSKVRTDHNRSIFKLLWAVFGSIGIAGALVFWMLYFGTEIQREVSVSILRNIGTGLGGAGVLWLFRAAFQRATKVQSEN
jgi:hypothetical protein